MTAATAAAPAPLLTVERPQPGRPLLATGPASAVIASADGSSSYACDTRGAALEWGGIYAQGIRLTGPPTLRVGRPEREVDLGPATLASLTAWRWRWEARHGVPDLEVLDELVPTTGLPGIGRRLTIGSAATEPRRVHVRLELPLFLAPVLIEGVRPHEFELRTSEETVFGRSHGWAVAVDSDPLPFGLAIDGKPWIGGAWSGELRSLRLDYALDVPAGGTSKLDVLVWGGLKATVDVAPRAGREQLERAADWSTRAAGPWQPEVRDVPVLETPDDPAIADAFRLAADGLRQLYSDPTPGMSGLVAGYPWYSTFWFRDIGWMLPAVLWLGDVDRVLRSVATAFRYQAPADLSLLGARAGELPMEVTPGPVFLFGTSDTPLYYPGIVRRYVRHTGDLEPVRPFRKGLERVLQWGLAKVDPASGLLRNGNEVVAIRAASTEVGRVHYGIDAFDTTIWDSTDRRDHAIDVQVLWHDALLAMADLDARFGGDRFGELRRRAEAVRTAVVDRYDWPSEGYLYDSLGSDGSPRARLRPNALRAVSLGFLTGPRAARAVERAARDDLSAPWGVRTLSSSDAAYDPQAYHDGQVWTIATAWAASAAFAAGRPELGVRYLDTIATRIRTEGGYAHECYRGDRPDPYDSCFLLGFSVAPFLSAVFEDLWGLDPDLTSRSIRCRPNFPRDWTRASLRGVRFGPGRLDLEWQVGQLTATWNGPFPVTLAGDSGSVELAPGVPGRLPTSAPASA